MVIIFDFDGTLHKTDEIYGYAVRKVSNRAVTNATLTKYLGMNADDMWKDFMPELSEADRQAAITEVGRYMQEAISAGKSMLYDDIPQLLNELTKLGHTLLILSNCTLSYMDALKQYFELDKWFDAFFCSEAYDDLPKKDIFLKIRDKYPGRYIMIGDRYSDIEVGVHEDVTTIGCLYGYGSEDELKAADFICNSVNELSKTILSLLEQPS